MDQQIMLSTTLKIVVAMTCLMVCGAVTVNDSGKLHLDINQSRDSKPLHSVNITQEKTSQLLQLIKKLKNSQQINDTKLRVGQSIPKWTTLNGDINFRHIRKRRATPPRPEQWNQQPVFNATKHIKRPRGRKLTICERVICDVGTYAKHCVVNFTADVCTPCPPGTYIYDVNKSEQSEMECRLIYHCHHWPGTVRTHEMHYCSGDHFMQCRCDTESGICGLDPCNCKKIKCRNDESLLQNCTCEQKIMTTVKGQVTTTAVPRSTYTPSPSREASPSIESPPQVKTDGAVPTTSTAVWEIATTATVTGKATVTDKCSDLGWIFFLSLAVANVIFLIYRYRQNIRNYLPSCLSDRLQFHQVPSQG